MACKQSSLHRGQLLHGLERSHLPPARSGATQTPRVSGTSRAARCLHRHCNEPTAPAPRRLWSAQASFATALLARNPRTPRRLGRNGGSALQRPPVCMLSLHCQRRRIAQLPNRACGASHPRASRDDSALRCPFRGIELPLRCSVGCDAPGASNSPAAGSSRPLSVAVTPRFGRVHKTVLRLGLLHCGGAAAATGTVSPRKLWCVHMQLQGMQMKEWMLKRACRALSRLSIARVAIITLACAAGGLPLGVKADHPCTGSPGEVRIGTWPGSNGVAPIPICRWVQQPGAGPAPARGLRLRHPPGSG